MHPAVHVVRNMTTERFEEDSLVWFRSQATRFMPSSKADAPMARIEALEENVRNADLLPASIPRCDVRHSAKTIFTTTKILTRIVRDEMRRGKGMRQFQGNVYACEVCRPCRR